MLMIEEKRSKEYPRHHFVRQSICGQRMSDETIPFPTCTLTRKSNTGEISFIIIAREKIRSLQDMIKNKLIYFYSYKSSHIEIILQIKKQILIANKTLKNILFFSFNLYRI